MAGMLRIGNAHGFWGDRLDAASEMLRLQPDLDYLTLDLLAEVSMSVLALQRQRDPAAGYVKDFIDIVESIAPYWRSGGRCRVITNAGGLDPEACARQCRRVIDDAGCQHIRIAFVGGDDVLDHVWLDAHNQSDWPLSNNLDTSEPITGVLDRLTTANAYMGAWPIVDALRQDADLVITGRVADPSLTVGPCIHHFGWSATDWNRLAGATVAGHLIECGTQVTGGILTDWLDIPNVKQIGFPLVEVTEDGSCTVTKPSGTGGCVSEATVKEQLLYEIGDPGNYLSPDVTVSFLSLDVKRQSANRVHVHGATGRPPPKTLKVSATYQDGYRSAGELTIIGESAAEKARLAGEVVLERLVDRGVTFADRSVDVIGTAVGAVHPGRLNEQLQREAVLRICVADPSRTSVEHFARAMMSLITCGPPGTTGYAEGRPRVRPMFRFWPCLIQRECVRPIVGVLPGSTGRPSTDTLQRTPSRTLETEPAEKSEVPVSSRGALIDIAYARSGDKGRHANIGVIARYPSAYEELLWGLTCDRVAEYFDLQDVTRVDRYELPNLCAINFVIQDILSNSLKLDSQGKALAQQLLQMPWPPDPFEAI